MFLNDKIGTFEERAPALRAELKRAGLKATPQRMAILECIDGDITHPTAQEVFDRLSQAHPSLSFATVYNTLAALTKVGQIRQLEVGGPMRFDPNATFHHHAICDRCGAVRDIMVQPNTGREEAAVGDGFAVERVEKIYRGTCKPCREQAPNTEE